MHYERLRWMEGRMHLLNVLRCLAAICVEVAQISGCGSGVKSAQAPIQAVVISTQLASQSVPLGQAAMFTVVASGTAPLAYRWSENGSPITGATGASYTTSDVAASDSGSQFTVTVSNSVNSVTSNVATLTVGPRSPKAGDLRFQEVGSPLEAEQSLSGTTSGIYNHQVQWFANYVGSPLALGDDADCFHEPSPSAIECVWGFFITPLPPGQSGLNTQYLGGQYANFDSDLTSNPVSGLAPPDAPYNVITSLDFQPAYNAYAIAWMQTTQQGGAFDLKREIVSPGAIQSTITADAATSRVVTAVSFDANGQANLLSYGWQGDTKTVYDSAVMTATTEQEIESAAQTLAGQGYILTAFGGDPTNGFLLIGTKVHGDTLARPLNIADQSTSTCSNCMVGYAPVMWYQAPAKDWAVIYEN
jgi:hypothetical protein